MRLLTARVCIVHSLSGYDFNVLGGQLGELKCNRVVAKDVLGDFIKSEFVLIAFEDNSVDLLPAQFQGGLSAVGSAVNRVDNLTGFVLA
ncbi:MAG: hypothetical protein NTV56_19480 [Alphaproteobacteria bacterium]|nr:hypothetical protein [Alphaproteobacteria bacterium]